MQCNARMNSFDNSKKARNIKIKSVLADQEKFIILVAPACLSEPRSTHSSTPLALHLREAVILPLLFQL